MQKLKLGRVSVLLVTIGLFLFSSCNQNEGSEADKKGDKKELKVWKVPNVLELSTTTFLAASVVMFGFPVVFQTKPLSLIAGPPFLEVVSPVTVANIHSSLSNIVFANIG